MTAADPHRTARRPAARPRTGALWMRVARIATPLGTLTAGADGDGLCLLEFRDHELEERDGVGAGDAAAAAILDQLAAELEQYFLGELRAFRVPVSARGTPFQQRAWALLRAIPYGETRTYRQQAESMGAPRAVRAVARANALNPIAIVVPCHRVVGSDGSLTGYAGGLHRKKYLLELERATARP